MDNIFQDVLDGFILVYLEGILVYSNSKQEHEEYLCIVFSCLREKKLYAKCKVKKC